MKSERGKRNRFATTSRFRPYEFISTDTRCDIAPQRTDIRRMLNVYYLKITRMRDDQLEKQLCCFSPLNSTERNRSV